MEVACIIPARGGSKGLPQKNRLELNGLPLISRSILHAKLARKVNRVFVSTDDAEISSIAIKYGADIIYRPSELSGDAASSESALLHALTDMDTIFNYAPEIIVFLQCTSPLRTHYDIDNAIQEFIERGYDSMLSVTRTHKFFWKKGASGPVALNYDYSKRPRRQDRDQEYCENGSIYIFGVKEFTKVGNRLYGNVGFFEMSAWSEFEIDDISDFKLCSWILNNIQDYKNYEIEMFAQFKKVKILVLDFDGVMTNNNVYISEIGHESVVCSRSDGWGISQLKNRGVKVIVLSKERNQVVQLRCQKLGIECYNGIDDKLTALKRILEQNSLTREDLAYMGNDLNDLECLLFAAISAAPCDAEHAILDKVKWKSSKYGGNGAVREFCDFLINNNLI